MTIYTVEINDTEVQPARTGLGIGYADLDTLRRNTLIMPHFTGYVYALEVEGGDIQVTANNLILFNPQFITAVRKLEEWTVSISQQPT
jgi:hypothetical protein